jgi:hypothetical protein
MGDLGPSPTALVGPVELLRWGGAPNLIPPSFAIRAAMFFLRVASSSSPCASSSTGAGGAARIGVVGLRGTDDCVAMGEAIDQSRHLNKV